MTSINTTAKREEEKSLKEYLNKIRTFFKYIKKHKQQITLKDFEKYIGTELQTEFQPINLSEEEDVIVEKYEALIRFKYPTKVKVMNRGEVLRFLSTFCSSDFKNPKKILKENREILKIAKEEKITLKKLELLKKRITNDLFKKNIKESFEQKDNLLKYKFPNKKTRVSKNFKISINFGINEILNYKNIMEDVIEDIVSQEKLENQNKKQDEIIHFLKSEMNLELLEYYIDSLDSLNSMKRLSRQETEQLTEEDRNKLKNYFFNKDLLKGLSYIEEMGTKVSLDDYKKTIELVRRIINLDLIMGAKFTTIKIDAEITQKLDLYAKIIQFRKIAQAQTIEGKKSIFKKFILEEISLFKYYLDIEEIEKSNLNIKEMNEYLKHLQEKAEEGMKELIKLLFVNSYHIKLDTFDEEVVSTSKRSEIFNYIAEIKKLVEVDNSQTRKEKRSIIFEKIENKDLVILIKQIIKNVDASIEGLFQGWYFSKEINPREKKKFTNGHTP